MAETNLAEQVADNDLPGGYSVKCARCGVVGLARDFCIEEGDEWECPPCNERCDAEEL